MLVKEWTFCKGESKQANNKIFLLQCPYIGFKQKVWPRIQRDFLAQMIGLNVHLPTPESRSKACLFPSHKILIKGLSTYLKDLDQKKIIQLEIKQKSLICVPSILGFS